MGISQIRGAILEEIVLFLLEKVGYRIVTVPDEGTRGGAAGLEVCGRGEWHQIDSLAAFDHTPAFMYPIRLIVEAKCYSDDYPVDLKIARSSLGVLTDISQNYFSFGPAGEAVQVQRYNYHAALFSTSGFTANAVRYCIAHQIFPIQYKDVPAIQPIKDLLFRLRKDDFDRRRAEDEGYLAGIRDQVRRLFRDPDVQLQRPFTEQSTAILRGVRDELRRVRGSYFGMLQGRWPLHLLSQNELPGEAFRQDLIHCEIRFTRGGLCFFRPSHVQANEPSWFELELSLPLEIVRLFVQTEFEPEKLAELKERLFSFVTLSGIIGGVRRQVRLQLDRVWLNQRLEQILFDPDNQRNWDQ